MKKHFFVGILALLFTLLITGCANYYGFSQQTQIKKNLLRETWMQQVNTNPALWTQKADFWFLRGEPNNIERYDLNAPSSTAMAIMNVRVPDFTSIQVDGRFQVQIVGRQEHNSVFVVGPNDQVRQAIIEVKGRTLCIRAVKDSKTSTNRVLIRIGIRNLTQLTSHGPCTISGRDITSNCLVIRSTSSAPIFLSGYMNLTEVRHTGTGTITVMGAYTPTLNLYVRGNGCVNVCGRVGVRYINHAGNGTINIIGADSDGLTIMASDASKTTIAGTVNLKKVTACDNSCVFLYWVNSNGTYVYGSGRAHIGLAGNTNNLNIDLGGSSRFDGQYLHGNNVYVRTRELAHANVCIGQKMFAAAGEQSSIYFYGSPNVVSRYISGLGTIIPVWDDSPISATTLPPRFQGPAVYPAPVRYPSFKDEVAYHVQEAPRPKKVASLYLSDRDKDGVYYRVKRPKPVKTKTVVTTKTTVVTAQGKKQYNE